MILYIKKNEDENNLMNKKRVRRKKVGRSFIRVFMSSGLFLFFFSNRKKDRARGPEFYFFPAFRDDARVRKENW